MLLPEIVGLESSAAKMAKAKYTMVMIMNKIRFDINSHFVIHANGVLARLAGSKYLHET
jgi:hypothetical protein